MDRQHQMLHVHIPFVASMDASYMAESGLDQHESRVIVRETSYPSGTVVDLPIEPFNHVVGADTSPVLIEKVAVS